MSLNSVAVRSMNSLSEDSWRVLLLNLNGGHSNVDELLALVWRLRMALMRRMSSLGLNGFVR